MRPPTHDASRCRGRASGRRARLVLCFASASTLPVAAIEGNFSVEAAVGLYAAGALPFLGNGKCGVAVSAADEGGGVPFTAEMLRIGAAMGLSWQTHWNAASLQPGFAAQDYQDVRLVPQFWDAALVNFDRMRVPLAGVVLGFNEPDQGGLGGTGMSVSEALGMWMPLVGRARAAGYGLFVAPSIAQPLPSRYTGKAGGSEWLPQFLDMCLTVQGCPETITFLGFHLYEPRCTTDPAIVQHWSMDTRVGSMKRLMAEFNGRGMGIQGLWLTEFAGRSDSAGFCRTLAQQRGWMEVVVPMLNADPAIVAYSWFSYGEGRSPYFSDNANLWDYETNQLNELGEAYFRICAKRTSIPVAPPFAGGQVAPASSTQGASVITIVARSFLLVMCAILGVGAVLAVTVFGLAAFVPQPGAPADGLGAYDSVPSRLSEAWAGARRALLGPDGLRCPRFCTDAEASPSELDTETRRALHVYSRSDPALVAGIMDCCALLEDKHRFALEYEHVFWRLRHAILAASAQNIPGCSLAAAPAKLQVWEFLVRFGEENRVRNQNVREVFEVFAVLEAIAPWQAALRERAGLYRRRRGLSGFVPI